MCTGTLPFRGETSALIFNAILERAPVAPVRLNPDVPAELERIINKALEKDRDVRSQSAAELRADLKRLKRDTASGKSAATGAANAGSALSPTEGGSGSLTVIKGHKLWLVAGLIVVGLVIGAVLYSTHSVPSGKGPQVKTTYKQFTFAGNAYSPAISPDGMFVAYVAKNGEEQKLMVQASNGSTLELARGTWIDSPRWSLDGSELLFFRFEPVFGIFLVSRLGGVARPIGSANYACWLSGSQIVTAGQSEPSGFKGIRLVNKLTGEAKEVRLSEYTFLTDIDCSPHAGAILTVTEDSEKFQIRIFKPDGSEQRKLIEESDGIYSARWSPTGDSIYYLHGKGSTQELSKLSVTAPHPEPIILAGGLQTGGFFTISADGSRLAYTREDYNSNLWRVDLPTAGKRSKPEISRLTSGTSYYGAPNFSPDGRWVAFPLGSTYYETNIFKMQVAVGEPVQLTYFEHAGTFSPAWSPDGKRIAFISDQNRTSKVWTITANGGTPQPTEKTNASGTNNNLSWSPSSEIVYQKLGDRNFLRINDKTQAEETIIQHDESVGWVPFRPVFSSDGKEIAAYWNRDEPGLWIISLEPYSETLVQAGEIYPFGWSPDGRYVYAIRRGARELIRVQVAAPHGLTSVVALPGDVSGYDSASVSPDGREAVVSVGKEKSEVWLMENFDPAAPLTRTPPN